MNATTRKTRSFLGAAAFLAVSACPCEASLLKMGFHQDGMSPVDMDEVHDNFDRFRKLQTLEMRKLQSTEIFQFGDGTTIELDVVEENDHSAAITQAVEDAISNKDPILIAIDKNETSMDEEEEQFIIATESDETDDFPFIPEIVTVQNQLDQQKKEQEANPPTNPPTMDTGPRGGFEISPYNQPTEISFMIIMEDFRYSGGVTSMDDITIGTKFGFTGRIATKAEDLGQASGSCTVTSAIEKDLSYCDIYHKIDTDNYGGFGSVIAAGTADEVGGQYLVTGTGGSLQSTSQGYAMIQFDPAGNPVIYVLLKLF